MLKGRVCVVTGPASGIGLAMAERFAREGMNIVLADVEAPALAAAEEAFKHTGTNARRPHARLSLGEREDFCGDYYPSYCH